MLTRKSGHYATEGDMINITSLRRSGIVIAILAVAMFFGSFSGEVAYADGLNVTQHSKQDVVNQLKNSGVSINDPVTFTVQPVKNTQRGALTNNTKQSALKMLNNIRYVSGLDPVSLNETYGGKAQAAAFVNWSIGQLTHYPSNVTSKPDDMSTTDWNDGNEGAGNSNIAYGRDTINNTIVFGWMGDSSSATNVENVGHRRWCLNPYMSSTGFGATRGQSYLDKYYAMWSADDNANGSQKNVAWPARYMPVEFFDGNIPWSLSTGNTSITNISNVSVQLNRRTTSPSGSGSWSFSTSKTYTAATTGEYFGVQINNPYQGYSGQPGPFVVFRPANITYKVGDIFDVTITGLGSSAISYTVEFISGYPVETMSFEEEEYQLTSSYETIKPTVTPSSAKGYEVSYSSSDESVVTVNSNGTITKAGIGEATITATIAGKYTYNGSPLTASYRVKVPKSINSDDVKIKFEQYVYYSTKKADIGLVITDGDKTLVEGTDYTVSIPDDAIKPKWSTDGRLYNYTATISGIGNYYGSDYEAFWIWPKYLSDCRIVLTPESAEYTGGNQKPSVAVYNGDVLMTAGTDYTVTQNNGGTNRGSYTVRVSAASNSDCYANSGSATFVITEKTITEDMIGDIASSTYDGNAKTPDIIVRNGNVTLIKNTDYTVEYSNNTNAGKATATITGKGNYKGTVSKDFTISAKPLTDNMVTLNKTSSEFNGENQKPTVTVKDGSRTLNEGVDYTLTNEGGTNAGTYTVSVEGKGNYSGTISKDFTITRKALTEDMINISESTFTYNGETQKPDQVTVKFGDLTLAQGDDYTLTNEGSVNAGKYEVTVSAKADGNYSGTATKAYTISKKPVNEDMINLSGGPFTYNGKTQKPDVTVMDGAKELDDAYYELINEGGKNAGDYTVTLSGKGNYSGNATKTFTIKKLSIGDSSILASAQDVTYTGSEIVPEVTVSFGDTGLINGEDFTVNFSGNSVNVGEVEATIEGKGNFEGQRNVSFNITQKNLNDGDISVEDIPQQVLEGDSVEPTPVIKHNGKTLTTDDVALSYEANTSEGTGKVTVKGKGNFSGERILEFRIVSRERMDLNQLITTLEQDLVGETDADFRAAIGAALLAAKKIADNNDATPDELTNALTAAQKARSAAQTALQQKKDAEAQAKAEEEARKKAEAAARARQKGSDGTAVGAGASAEYAEKAILAATSDEGPKGSKYAPLTLKSTAQTKTSVTLTWTKNSKAKKYVVYGNACGKNNKLKKLKTVTGKSCKITKISKTLKKGTYHKFMIVALNADNNVVSTSKVVHVATKGGKVGNHKSVTIKAKVNKSGKAIKSYKALTATKIKKGKAITITTTLKPVSKKLKVKKHRGVCYESSDVKIATVNAKGKIVAKKKGTCYIYAYAQNGVSKRIKVTVK